MTITDYDLKNETANVTTDGVEYEQTYIITYTGGWSAAGLVNHAEAGLPSHGEQHAIDTSVYANSVTIKADSEPPLPAGTATYVIRYATPDIATGDGIHPLQRAATIQWGGSDLSEVRRFDIDDLPLANSAGDYIEDLPSFFIRGGQVTITYNTQSNPADLCVNFSNTTNANEWYGVAEGNGLIGIITASQQTETYGGADITFWQVSVPIFFRRDGWKLKVFDYGYRYLNAADEVVSYLDPQGNQSPVPVFLDGAGAVLTDQTSPVFFPDEGYSVYEDTDWNDLDLVDPFSA